MGLEKTIGFDLDNTLIINNTWDIILDFMKIITGKSLDELEMLSFEIMKDLNVDNFVSGSYLSFEEIIKKYNKKEFKNHEKQILDYIKKYLDNEVKLCRLRKDTVSLLSSLLQQGYSLYLVTQGDEKRQKEKIDDFGLKEYFEKIYIVKDDKEKVIKKNTIYVGDSVQRDIVPAFKAGAVPILLNEKSKEMYGSCDVEVEDKILNLTYTANFYYRIIRNLNELEGILSDLFYFRNIYI